MKSEKEKQSCKLNEKFLSFDKFGKSFTLHLDEGKDSLPSITGALCSLATLIILIFYTGYKINIMESK